LANTLIFSKTKRGGGMSKAQDQAIEDRKRTRDIEERKDKAQQDEDRRKTDLIEQLKRKQGGS
jgi:hypothetical protein